MKEKEIADALLNPFNIGRLKKAIEHMNPEMLVFRFDYGNLDGYSSWRRKKTWKQYLKELAQPKPEGSEDVG